MYQQAQTTYNHAGNMRREMGKKINEKFINHKFISYHSLTHTLAHTEVHSITTTNGKMSIVYRFRQLVKQNEKNQMKLEIFFIYHKKNNKNKKTKPK